MTAEELATTLEVYARYRDDNKGSALKAAAMLRQQAEQIESLKADVERLDALDKTCTAYGFQDIHEGNTWTIDGPFNNIRAAIDAMKDAT